MANKLVKIMFISCLASLSGFPLIAMSAPSSTVAVSPTTVVVPTFVATPTPEVDKCERYENAPGCNPAGCVPASDGSTPRSCKAYGAGEEATCKCQCKNGSFECGTKCCSNKDECIIYPSGSVCNREKEQCTKDNLVRCGNECCDTSLNECVHLGDGGFKCEQLTKQCKSPQFVCKSTNNASGVTDQEICCNSKQVCTQQFDEQTQKFWPKCTDVISPCNPLIGQKDCTAMVPGSSGAFAHTCCGPKEDCMYVGNTVSCRTVTVSRTATPTPPPVF